MNKCINNSRSFKSLWILWNCEFLCVCKLFHQKSPKSSASSQRGFMTKQRLKTKSKFLLKRKLKLLFKEKKNLLTSLIAHFLSTPYGFEMMNPVLMKQRFKCCQASLGIPSWKKHTTLSLTISGPQGLSLANLPELWFPYF